MKPEKKEGRVGRKNKGRQRGLLVLWAQCSERNMDTFMGSIEVSD